MTSAYASAPPPFRFGRVELRANARKFLERALVISLLVHLSAVGVFREMERRATPPAEVELVLPPWHGTHVTPPIVDPAPPRHEDWRGPETGTIVPVDKPTFKVPATDPTAASPSAIPGAEPGALGLPGPGGPGPAPAETALPFDVVDVLPVPTFAPKPAYPEWARDAGVEGKVLLRVLVGVDGAPKKVTVLSGTTGLTDAAVGAVWKWRFSPGLTNKKPVEVSVEIPFSFRL